MPHQLAMAGDRLVLSTHQHRRGETVGADALHQLLQLTLAMGLRVTGDWPDPLDQPHLVPDLFSPLRNQTALKYLPFGVVIAFPSSRSLL